MIELAIELAIDRNNGLLLVEFCGPFTAESLVVLDERLQAFVAREGVMPTIIDFTGVDAVNIAVATMVGRGGQRSQLLGQRRIFVSSDLLLFGLLRLYGAYQDIEGEIPPITVRSLPEAFAELGISGPMFEPISNALPGLAAMAMQDVDAHLPQA
jgi:anti-anti-sigma regulatory factor